MSNNNNKYIFLNLQNKIILPQEYFSIPVNQKYKDKENICISFINNNQNTQSQSQSKIIKTGVFCEVISQSSGVISTIQGTNHYNIFNLKAIQKVNILDPSQEQIYFSNIETISEALKEEDSKRLKKENLLVEVISLFEKYFSTFTENQLLNKKLELIKVNPDIYSWIYLSYIKQLSYDDKLKLLLSQSIYERLMIIKNILINLNSNISTQLNQVDLSKFINNKNDINANYNSQNYKKIQKNDSIDDLIQKVNNSKMHDEAKEIAINELSNNNSNNSPFSEQKNWAISYVKTLLSMPWEEYSKDEDSIIKAEIVLNKDHYGLEKVKERILEFLSVRKVNPNLKGSILCLNGPPGVGKTSLVKSIAEALNRKFSRISLGGIRDESTIRGHKRTYIAAMPGNIMQTLKKVKSSNPVILLDEIDKLGYDNVKGDVESALLEVLDPEQNNQFKDHYLNTYFDISKVLFICTSNNIEKISPPLKDRLEIINISGYTIKEKVEIAKKYLIPKQINQCSINKFMNLIISDEIIYFIIDSYTYESGVRSLEKKIEGICRYLVKENIIKYEKANINDDTQVKVDDFVLSKDFIRRIFGSEIEKIDIIKRTKLPGVSIGLAYNIYGGSLILIETSKSKNINNTAGIELTGNVKQIMKESVYTSLSWIKSNIHLIKSDFNINEWNFHIHVPEAATPKDGPSAGITICSALVSLILNKPIRNDTAMTGEMSLAGFVLPIGGVKEKIMSGYSNGIKRFIIPKGNKKDYEEVFLNKDLIGNDVLIIYAEHINDVLSNIFNFSVFDSQKGFTDKHKF